MLYIQEIDGKQGVKKSRDPYASGLPVVRVNFLDPITLGLHQMIITIISKARGCQVDLVKCLCASVDCKAACTELHMSYV